MLPERSNRATSPFSAQQKNASCLYIFEVERGVKKHIGRKNKTWKTNRSYNEHLSAYIVLWLHRGSNIISATHEWVLGSRVKTQRNVKITCKERRINIKIRSLIGILKCNTSIKRTKCLLSILLYEYKLAIYIANFRIINFYLFYVYTAITLYFFLIINVTLPIYLILASTF